MQISRLVLLPLLSLLLPLLAACRPANAADSIPSNWSTTSIQMWGVAISYPPGWSAVDLPELGFVTIREPDGPGNLAIWEMSYAAAEAIGLPYGPEMSGEELLQLMSAPKASERGYSWQFSETEILVSPAGAVYVSEAHSAPLAARTYLAVLPLADRVLTFEVRLQLDRTWARYRPIYEQIIQTVAPIGHAQMTY